MKKHNKEKKQGKKEEDKEKNTPSGDVGQMHDKKKVVPGNTDGEKAADNSQEQTKTSSTEASVPNNSRERLRKRYTKTEPYFTEPSVKDSGSSVMNILSDFKSQLKSVQKIKEALENDFHVAEKARLELERENTDLKAKLEMVESRARETTMLEEEIAFVEEERARVVENVSSLEKELVIVKNDKESLENDNDSLHTQVAKLKSRMSEVESNVMDAISEKEIQEKSGKLPGI